jgi:Terpene cyclase DEP1
MSGRLVSLLVVIALFSVLTVLALMDVGYFGIIEPHFQSLGAGQVFADLVILAVLACFWMVGDAKARGLNPWPFIALALVGGSFGPLLYLVVRELKAGARKAVAP